MEQDLVNQITLIIIGSVATIITGMTLFFLRRYIIAREQCFKDLVAEQVKQGKRIFRIQKGLLVIMQELDAQTAEFHDVKPRLKELMKEMLTDSEDNL